QHPLDARERRTRDGHEGVVHRVENLVGEPERAVAERLLEEVVGGGDRSDERVLDRQAAGLRPSLAHGGHHVRRLPAGKGDQLRPAAPGRRLAERSMSALNGNAHTLTPRVENKKPRRGLAGGASGSPVGRYSTLPTPDGGSAAPGLVK